MAANTLEDIKKNTVKTHRSSFFKDLEFLIVNKVLFLGISTAMGILLWVSYVNYSTYQILPGMTESNPFNINFQEPVVVKEILVQSGQLINKGDVLFILKRPDIQMRHYENKALLKQSVVELNILYEKNWYAKKWATYLQNKQDKNTSLSVSEMKFLAMYETDQFLENEKQNLKVVAPVTGHAGEILINVGETVAPYTSLISVYRPKASIVKSYIPETFNIAEINRNRKSIIRSMSRSYQIHGDVISIGTMLTELPARFQKDPLNKLYGREIKISLPEGNKFFLGEKVFVSLEGS